jgi:hypothetical protein
VLEEPIAQRVPRERIAHRIDAGRYDVHAVGSPPLRGLIREKAIAGHNGIAFSHQRAKATDAARMVRALGRIGITQEDRVVEIKDEPIHPATQPGSFPERRHLALQDDALAAQPVKQPHARDRSARQSLKQQLVADGLKMGLQRRQSISTADVLEPFDDSGDLHVGPP